MKQEQVGRELTKEENKYLSKQINEWLRVSCCKQDFYKFLQDLTGVTDLYLLAIAKLLNNNYLRLFNFYFHTLIQQY